MGGGVFPLPFPQKESGDDPMFTGLQKKRGVGVFKTKTQFKELKKKRSC